jgi:hypothetical protein
VLHLRRLLIGAGIEAGAVFRSVNKGSGVGSRLTTRDVPRILKRVVELAGLEAKGISGHSCRVGMAQDLAVEGAELPAIMQAGRWKSPEMPVRYAECMIAGRGGLWRKSMSGGATELRTYIRSSPRRCVTCRNATAGDQP